VTDQAQAGMRASDVESRPRFSRFVAALEAKN